MGSMTFEALSLKGSSFTAPRFWSLLRKAIAAHSIFILMIMGYLTCLLMVTANRPDLVLSNFFTMSAATLAFFMPIMLIAVLFLRLYHVVTVVKPERPIAALLHDLKTFVGSPSRLAQGLPILLLMLVFMYVFIEFKSFIPRLNPFSWDESMAEWDRILHFGAQPWEWLEPLFGYGPMSVLLNVNYCIWFAVMWSLWAYFAFAERPSELRTRFFLTFFALWIIGGSLMAILLSSAGPAFYAKLLPGPDPFAPLMASLKSYAETLPLTSVALQEQLWLGYQNDAPILSISAMPSMHNATALLFALAGFQINRKLGWVLAIHAAFIFIGSIMLAWHYAVDSYVSWILVLGLWIVMGKVARWWHGTVPQQAFAAAVSGAARG
jgi:hypothetical protein